MIAPDEVNRLLAYSARESARFGLRIFRGNSRTVDAHSLREEIERERVDIAILRIPAQSLGIAATLVDAGFHTIVADTLVHYSIDLRGAALSAPIDASLRLRPVETGDESRLESMVREIFSGYTSHYHANPQLPAARILDGYAEWALRHITPNTEGRSAWIIESGGEVAAFSCIQTAADRSEVIGVLNGVLPEKRGRGIYRDMLRSMLRQFAAEHIPRFAISTQVHNIAVQRVWANEGIVLDRAENTIHINAFLGGGTS